jgi:hypothetical protein
LRVVERARARRVAEVGEVAREEVGGEISVAAREARGVRVELAPEMQAAIEGVVHFDDEAACEFALEADVGLIAFGDAQGWIEAAREVRLERRELFDDGRIYGEHVRETEVRGDESATLRRGQQFSCDRIAERVGIEEDAPRAEREIVQSTKQGAVEEEPRAEADDGLARVKRIVGERGARGEVVSIPDDRLPLVAQAVRDGEVLSCVPLGLREESGVDVPLLGLAVEALAKAFGRALEKPGGAREIERAARVRKVYEGGTDALHVAAETQRVRAAQEGQSVLHLRARLAAVARARVR